MSWDGFCVLWGLVSSSRLYVNVRSDITLDRSVRFFKLADAFTDENENVAIYRAYFIICDIADLRSISSSILIDTLFIAIINSF